jgi:hypothetical protein
MHLFLHAVTPLAFHPDLELISVKEAPSFKPFPPFSFRPPWTALFVSGHGSSSLRRQHTFTCEWPLGRGQNLIFWCSEERGWQRFHFFWNLPCFSLKKFFLSCGILFWYSLVFCILLWHWKNIFWAHIVHILAAINKVFLLLLQLFSIHCEKKSCRCTTSCKNSTSKLWAGERRSSARHQFSNRGEIRWSVILRNLRGNSHKCRGF